MPENKYLEYKPGYSQKSTMTFKQAIMIFADLFKKAAIWLAENMEVQEDKDDESKQS